MTIGRSSENDIVIDDVKVSRHHLQIVQDDYGNFRLADFGSTNGTYVNGEKIKGEVRLSPNDIVKIGTTVLPWKKYFIGYTQDAPTSYPNPTNPPITQPRERHGFITFWLILGLFGGLVSPIIAIMQYSQVDAQVNYYRGTDMWAQIAGQMESLLSIQMAIMILSIVSALYSIACILLLFNWKKIGFYGAILGGVLFGGISIYLMSRIGDVSGMDISTSLLIPVIAIVLSPLIQYAIFQLKKGGVKFWDNLE
jgi:hypothetical protein